MKLLIVIFMLLVTILNIKAETKDQIVLTTGGNSPYTVVYATNATDAEKNAIHELTEHLKLVSGANLPIKNEDEKLNVPAIYVGQTVFAKKHGISFQDFGSEEWLIKTIGKDIVIGGGRPRGTIYGVWEFLEQQTGIMWLDENFTYLPQTDKVTIPENLDLRGKPAFTVRGIYAYHKDEPVKRVRFMARNRQNLFNDESNLPEWKQWGLYPVIGSPRACHTFYDYTKNWPAEYENCFSLNTNGRRLRATSARGPGQVCFSNSKTRELFVAKLREYIKADRKQWPDFYPTIYDISANDNEQKCECKDCLSKVARYGTYSGVVLEFINAIASDIAKDYSDIKIQTFAYLFSVEPPQNIKAESNVLIRLAQLLSEYEGDGYPDALRPLTHPNNQFELKRLREWGKVSRLAGWEYWVIFFNHGPATSIPAISANMKIYRQNRVESVFAECEEPEKNSFYALRLWLGYKLMQNPDQDASLLIDRFMNAYYGKLSSPFMRQYLNYLETRTAEVKGHLSATPIRSQVYLDNAFFIRAEYLFDLAEKAAANDVKTMSRIAKERAYVDFARLERERVGCLPPNQIPDRRTVIARFKKSNATIFDDYIASNQREKNKQAINDYIQGISVIIPPPVEFKDQDVIDIPWTQIWLKMRAKYCLVLVDDNDAAGGKAVKLGAPSPNLKLESREFHAPEMKIGLYSAFSKHTLINKTIPRTELAKDEKFHYYSLGEVTLEPQCYVYAHWTSIIQIRLWEFYTGKLASKYKIYLSLKVQGPAYVTGSKKDDAVLMDRLILIPVKHQ